MKKALLIPLLLTLVVFAFNFQSHDAVLINNVSVQFVATNGYGNNLYVDNFILGTQYQYDVAVSSINIPKDSNYTTNGAVPFKILPRVIVNNIGTSSAGSFNMVLQAGSYNSTKPAPTIAPGSSAEILFDSMTITPNTALNIKSYSTWSQDQNKSNDTLSQYTMYFPGTKRKVLIEAFTQWNCAPCASNNPYLDAFIVAKWDTVCAIKYHGWWPGANNDPMFLANVSQNRNRIQYYGVSGVPDGNFDGTFLHVFPYSPETQLSNPYYSRLSKGTPLSLTVTDTRIAGDTIKASITLNILSPLMAGNYRLRINAIERTRIYIGGSNGETVFKDIFRKMYPDSNGISIPTAAGIYNYEYKYKRETEWIDSLIYTVVFVQNDVNKEVMNCNKARNYLVDRTLANNTEVKKQLKKQIPSQRTGNSESGQVILQQPCTDEITAGFNFESFESGFPPSGWQVVNGNAGSITWEGYTGANGPLIGGTKSARMNFYAYSSQGHIDYLKSRIYNNIDLTDSLKFNWAYAMYPGYTDRLQVQVSTNGGSTYPFTVFDRQGATLETAPSTTSDFVPTSASQWG
ncbi:MAG: hypothetical protein L0Y76_08770, partial [Ignavibacteria bacterium]|nr:hypothetical protein [Ignavibacteria bacterium]